MSKLVYTLQGQSWHARAWNFTLNWIEIKTPAFMPVWTKATIKWMPLEMMNGDWLWTDPINLILANTFHLYLSPGDQRIKNQWWLHKFENWDRLILTDSRWFQVFSLWLSKSWKSLVRIVDSWVEFRSPKDGSKHFFTPTWVVDIQRNFWSDIMMVLDVCSPTRNISKDTVAQHMKLTHQRATQQFDYFETCYNDSRGVLFPIIQWWLYKDLRQESLSFLQKYARDWIAIWWLSVWETRDEMAETLWYLADNLPKNVPRYLMWVGTPEDLLVAIENGIDMFDCVHPTRIWRHGVGMKLWWNIKITNTCHRDDPSSLVELCPCYTCRNFSKAYIHHLFREWEALWWTLLSLHNISYLTQICTNKRQKIMSKSV